MRALEVGFALALGAALNGCGGRVTSMQAAGRAPESVAGASSSAGGDSASGGTAGAALTQPVAGSAGTVITNVDVNTVAPSAGCTHPLPTQQVLGVYSQYSVAVTGQTLDPSFSVKPHSRDYFVWVPKDYDGTKPYRVTFQYMACGDRSAAASENYKLMDRDPESIYVAMDMAPDGLPPADAPCFDVTTGRQSVEWEAMGVVASAVQKSFCVDEHRVFVSGYSSGASVTNLFGCYFAGKDASRKFGPDIMIRGQSGVAGIPTSPDVPCGGKVAAFWIHDTDDKENVIGGNASTSLPRVLAVNGCENGVNGPRVVWGNTAALNSVCTQYTACPADYPVIFCTTSGNGHSAQDNLAVPGFIEFQNLMNAQ